MAGGGEAPEQDEPRGEHGADGPEPRATYEPYQPYEAPVPETAAVPTRSGGGAIGVVVALLVLALVGVGVVVAALGGADQDTATGSSAVEVERPSTNGPLEVDTGPAVGAEAPDVLSRTGLQDLVDAVRQATGDTAVFRAVLYPDYASVAVPEDRTSERQRTLFWNGELRDDEVLGRSLHERVDLAALDGARLVRLLRRAAARVDDVTRRYVVLEGASVTFGEDARILAYATNDYSEGAYVIADVTGTVLRIVEF